MRGLILDLRFNPGGLLTTAIEVADLFVTKGKLSAPRGATRRSRSWDAHEEGTYEGFPMVVLVNRLAPAPAKSFRPACRTTSARWSWASGPGGKGACKTSSSSKGQSALKLTTASYQRPSGKNIHRFPDAKESDEWGVLPDPGYVMKLDDAELRQLILTRRNRDILLVNHHAAHDGTGDEGAADKPATPDSKDNADKPATEEQKPADGAAGTDKPATPPPADGEAAKGDRKPVFIDRQLQKAIDYLGGELAKAN